MNNCKNCGARYHPDECDYCGTPQRSAVDRTLTNKTVDTKMLQEYVERLNRQQQLREKSVWQGMLQGGASMLNSSSRVPWFLRF